ncbi:hypothetical protein [Kitasatospora sp. NPDC001175]|uniref:hypothetical protein n=1 Tax=Kitasatospora sp. NPDC001175 TaxID=3157103 RepID=UPI003D0302C5
MADDFSGEQSAPRYVAVAGILPTDAAVPVRLMRIKEGVIAAYNPAIETRDSVQNLLAELYGDLIDVTPAEVLAVAA